MLMLEPPKFGLILQVMLLASSLLYLEYLSQVPMAVLVI